MNQAGTPAKKNKSTLRAGPLQLQMLPDKNAKHTVGSSGREDMKLFKDLVDVVEVVEDQDCYYDGQPTPFSLVGLKHYADDNSLTTQRFLSTPGKNGEQFPVLYCCCGRHSQSSLLQISHPSFSTINPLHLSQKDIIETPNPLSQPDPSLLCRCDKDSTPIALSKSLTHALHRNMSEGDPKELIRNDNQPLKQNGQTRNPTCSDPSETVIRDICHPGQGRSTRTRSFYNFKTSYLLNTLFFQSFGANRKPTKAERRKIQNKTGISSRHLTYWLSNHKRRFKPELMAYRRLLRSGEIDSYDTFMEHCKRHHVPEIAVYGTCLSGSLDDDGSTLSSEGEETRDVNVDTE